MADHWLPYGETQVYVSVDVANLVGVAEPTYPQPSRSPTQVLHDAMANPSGPPLDELAGAAGKACIALDIYSHPSALAVALREVVNVLVDEVVPRERITVLLGSGEAPGGGNRVRRALEGDPLLRGVEVVEFNGMGETSHVGETSKGTPVEVSSLWTGADLRIALGQTRVDPLAGYAGAHSAVVPGLASKATIAGIRRSLMDSPPMAGRLELNPVKEGTLEALDHAGLDYAVNLVVDGEGRLLEAYSGSPRESWGKALTALAGAPEAQVEAPVDVVVVSPGGEPHDHTLYQATWALATATRALKRNGALVLLAQCSGGLGADAFQTLARVKDPKELQRRYMYGAEALALLREAQRRFKLVACTALPGLHSKPLGIEVARTANQALQAAYSGRRSRETLLVPQGCTTLIQTK